MYEGKNIHYSLVDQKPLCSFSGKICNQRRLNKYGFCVRHILEDPYAPFKRCAYVAKSSRQTCTQPIPKNEDREYCNNHMQVLGMLPKKERKTKKDKERFFPSKGVPLGGLSTESDSQHSQIKHRLAVGSFKTKLASNKSLSSEDVDDVYAFPADSNEKTSKSTTVSTITSIPVPDMTLSNANNVQFSTLRSKSPSEGNGGHSSLAKIYPELAEKLEKIKPKMEIKVKTKGKSSRTMNSLQTKIAQNKIKDKLKRNQSSSNASSQSQSPSHSFSNASSPGYHPGTSSPNVVVSIASPSIPHTKTLASFPTSQEGFTSITGALTKGINNSEAHQSAASKPSLSQLNLLNNINIQSLNLSLAQLGLPVPAVSDIEQTFKQLLKAANIPIDGANLVSDGPQGSQPSGAFSAPVPISKRTSLPQDLPGLLKPPYGPKSGPPPPYSSVHHKPADPNTTVPLTALSHVPSLPRESQNQAKIPNAVLSASDQSIRHVQQMPQSAGGKQTHVKVAVPHTTATVTLPSPLSSSSTSSSSSASLSSHLKHSSPALLSSLSSTPLMSPSASNTVTTVSDLTRKTPLMQSQQKSKASRSKPRSRNPSSATKRPVPVFTLPMTLVKPRKMRKLSDTSSVKTLKNKSAKSYCEQYDCSKRFNHNLIISVCDIPLEMYLGDNSNGFDSSDESDMSDCDILSWQPDWFRESSDEEVGEEDESDYDLRTAKLALARARLRRQCFQGRSAYRANHVMCRTNLQSTSALINAAKESQRSAVHCLNYVYNRPQQKPDKYKRRGLEKRKCLYKNSEEVQCTNNIVPYTNHCIKHVMYNVDQQLFEYCTAKFADNTQCCHPVIDVKHELPLCIEHGVKADNFLKTQDAEPKPKRPRKKTKPSALTRPPKKGKKKKNQRKNVRPQKPIPPEEPSGLPVSETEEGQNSGTQDEADEANNDTDTEGSTGKDAALTKMAILKAAPAPPPPSRSIPVSLKDRKVESKPVEKRTKGSAPGQLEELDNLGALTELDNVKMFGDLPLETASKLLEENDFQEVFSRLPDEAFDLFTNKSGGLPSSEELEELEKSLVMANRDFRMARDSFDQFGVVGSEASQISQPIQQPAQQQTQPPQQQPPQQQQLQQQQQQQPSLPPILDDADELTRQIAEEILNQNIGSDMSIGNTLCNGDAQESIKAIARSLSTSGMMLTSEGSQRSQVQDFVQNSGLSRSQSIQGYGNLGKVQNPPNVMIQSLQPHQPAQSQPSSVQLQTVPGTLTLTQSPISQSQMALTAQSQVPHNVTVMPQGIFQAQLPTASSMYASVTPTVPLSTAAFAGQQLVSGGQGTGILSFPGAQQLTPQQLSQLVQQASLQLPPLPPYTPPSQPSVATVSVATSATPVASTVKVAAPVTAAKPLTAEQISQQKQHIQQQQQQLARQQEQLSQQQQLLTLQQQLAALARQSQLAQAGKAAAQQGLTQNINISTLLQPSQINQITKVNQHMAQSLPSIGQITQSGKCVSLGSTVTHTSHAPVNLPSTNIVWTAPPNVTITMPNGIPRGIVQPAVTTSAKQTSNKVSLKDAFIDLTESCDPPPYTAQPATGLIKTQSTTTLTTTAVTGKS